MSFIQIHIILIKFTYRIVLPSFSDIFRGKFTPREEEAPSDTAKEGSKEQQEQENASLFDVAEKETAAPQKVYDKVRLRLRLSSRIEVN